MALARAWPQLPSQTSCVACDMVLAFAGHLNDEEIKADVADQAVARFIRHLQDRGRLGDTAPPVDPGDR